MSRALAAFQSRQSEIVQERDRVEQAARAKMAYALQVLGRIASDIQPIADIRVDLTIAPPAPAAVIAGVARYDIGLPWRGGQIRIRCECGTSCAEQSIGDTWLRVELFRLGNLTGKEDCYSIGFDPAHADDAAEFVGEWIANLLEQPTHPFPTTTTSIQVVKKGRRRKGRRS